MRIRSAVLFLVLFTVGVPSVGRAQNPTPPPVHLAVPYDSQNTIVWCWVSAAKMVMQYRNMSFNLAQCQMLEIGYGLPPGYCCTNPQRCMRGAQHMFEVQQLISHVGGTPTMVARPAYWNELYEAFQNDHPVIAELVTSPASSHAVVLTGMDFYQECGPACPYGPQSCQIYCQVTPLVSVNDPFSGRYQMPYPRLISVWRSALVVL